MWLEAGQGLVSWGGVGLRLELGGDGGGGGVVLHTTSGSSVCGQGGCQAMGLWIAGDCLRGVWGEAEEEDE